MPLAQDSGSSTSTSIWSPDGRVGRWHYFWMLVLTTSAGFVAGALAEQGGLGVLLAILLLVPAVWVTLTTAAKRCHDRGHSAAWVLLSFVPLVNVAFSLYLLFAPGSKEANEYGPPPDPR